MYAYSFANMHLYIDHERVEITGDDFISIEPNILQDIQGKAVDHGGKIIFRLPADSSVITKLREVGDRVVEVSILDDEFTGIVMENGIVSKTPASHDHQGDWELSFSKTYAHCKR